MGQIAVMAHNLLVQWSGLKFGQLSKQIEKVKKELSLAQQQDILAASCDKCLELEKKIDDLHEIHEAYWYLRSRVAEVRDDDKNTKYFHHKTSQRKKKNYVKGLFDNHG